MIARLTHGSMAPALVRALCLYVPISAVLLLWFWRRPDSKVRAGILVACVWNASYVLALNLIALHFGWWRFFATGGLLAGMPVDLWIGWFLLWGAAPILAFPKNNVGVVVIIFGGIDFLFMPHLLPVLRLGSHWMLGEALGLSLCLVPSLLLARWTAAKENLNARAVMQFFAFSAMSMGLLPAMVLYASGGAWAPLWMRSPLSLSIWLQALALPATFGLSAVQEFAVRGGGTPLPYDPPKRLVTSGVYAYTANPMQASSTVLLAGLGCMLHSLWVVALAAVAAIYSVGIAAWDETTDLAPRFGERWREYCSQVKAWRIRWRPWADPRRRARIYISQTCSPCAQISNWFVSREVIGLDIVAAEHHPDRDLTRITYDPGDGNPEERGIAALARGLEHINIGWAFCGFVLRLPLLCSLIQALVDVSGGEEHVIARTSARSPQL